MYRKHLLTASRIITVCQKKFIVGDFYFVDQFISNINTNKFTNKKTRQTKKNYQHHFIGNFMGKYVILPTNKTVCNSIRDFFSYYQQMESD